MKPFYTKFDPLIYKRIVSTEQKRHKPTFTFTYISVYVLEVFAFIYSDVYNSILNKMNNINQI